MAENCSELGESGDFPGLGNWPPRLRGAGLVTEKFTPLLGVSAKVSLRLPGITRVIHLPINDAMYYEWFVQQDPDHYNYFQIAREYAQTSLERAWFLARYYAWGRP